MAHKHKNILPLWKSKQYSSNFRNSFSLHTACLKGSVECLDVLLEEQPDLSSVDKLGKFTVLLKRELRSHCYCTLNLEKNLELHSCLQCMSLKNKLWFMYLSLHVHDCMWNLIHVHVYVRNHVHVLVCLTIKHCCQGLD